MFSFWQMLKRSFTNRDEEQLENKEPESKQEEVEPTQPIKEQKFPEEAGTRKQFPPGNRNNGTFRKEVVAVAGQEVVANIPEVVEHEELAPINRENLERDLADLLREIEALERDQVAMSQSFLIKMNEMEQKLKTINHQQSLLIAAAGLGVSVLPPEIPMPERMIHGRVASPSPLHGYHCICKKQYAWLTSLEKHIKFATKEWKFLCDLCNMRFPLASDRRRHMMKTHRVKDPESGFGCMDCGDVLTDRKALCNHKFYMHGIRSGKRTVMDMQVENDGELQQPPEEQPGPSRRRVKVEVDAEQNVDRAENQDSKIPRRSEGATRWSTRKRVARKLSF